MLKCIDANTLSVNDGHNFLNDKHRNRIRVLQVLEYFCIGQTNVIYEHVTFNKREQEMNKTIDNYDAL